jgi:hypothetical protein
MPCSRALCRKEQTEVTRNVTVTVRCQVIAASEDGGGTERYRCPASRPGEWLANQADLKAHLGVISSLPHLHIAVCINSALLGPR